MTFVLIIDLSPERGFPTPLSDEAGLAGCGKKRRDARNFPATA
jgi:hypothetical protein